MKSRLHQVRMSGHARVRLRGADPLAAPDTRDPGGAHQPGYLVPADVITGTLSRLPDLPGTVDPVVVLPQLPHDRADDLIALVPHRGLAVLDRVVAARGHLQHAADELDPQTPAGDDIVAVGVDEHGYFLCWRSSSAPKKLAALFKISLARFSSRFSCSSSFSLAASLVLTPGTWPSSMSAWRTQERTDSVPYPSWARPGAPCRARFPAQHAAF